MHHADLVILGSWKVKYLLIISLKNNQRLKKLRWFRAKKKKTFICIEVVTTTAILGRQI